MPQPLEAMTNHAGKPAIRSTQMSSVPFPHESPSACKAEIPQPRASPRRPG